MGYQSGFLLVPEPADRDAATRSGETPPFYFDLAAGASQLAKAPSRCAITRGAYARSAIGIDAAFVQDNHVRSPAKGTLRGLHYQIPPAAQGKLVRVTRGAIFDVAVDIRRGSPTFGHCAHVVLSGTNWHQLWVPAGFAHGYCTLEDETEVQYKVTDYYSPPHERGIAWNDPQLLIAWPIAADRMVVSERDRQLPYVAHQPDLFEYGL